MTDPKQFCINGVWVEIAQIDGKIYIDGVESSAIRCAELIEIYDRGGVEL